jgi:hypothetical protein
LKWQLASYTEIPKMSQSKRVIIVCAKNGMNAKVLVALLLINKLLIRSSEQMEKSSDAIFILIA